jgi:hypothetical protein
VPLLYPPATSTIPSFSSVAVASKRPVFILPVKTNPAVTVNVVEPLIEPDTAMMVASPTPTVVANPVELIAATFAPEELQVTPLVRFCVLLSEYVPVAVNCAVLPAEIDGFVGVTAIETSTGGVTVSVVEPVIDPRVAVMVVDPVPVELASPVALIVAMPVADELHVAVLVRFCVLPSLYVPVAVNCSVWPRAINGFVGVIAMETSVGVATVSVVDPLMDPIVAVTVVDPMLVGLARPVALIVATPVGNVLHVAALVRFCVLPSV